ESLVEKPDTNDDHALKGNPTAFPCPAPVPFSSVYQNADGRQEIFIVGNSGAAFHNWQTSPNLGWNGFSIQTSPALKSDCVLGRNEDGRLEAFAIGTDGNVY